MGVTGRAGIGWQAFSQLPDTRPPPISLGAYAGAPARRPVPRCPTINSS